MRAVAGAACCAAALAAETNMKLENNKDKASYAIGMDIGRSFKKQQLELNMDAVTQGVRDAYSGKKELLLTDEQTKEVMETFKREFMAKRETVMKEAGVKNKEEGEKFLAANKSKEGVKTTASGLQYKVLKEGTGPKPKANDTVRTHYRGTLIDGTEFDSSFKRNEPATFPLNGVIPAWTEALQLMPVGSKWQLFAPSELAYGERGAGQDIGPNSTLIFEVELLSIEAAKE
jgi:FKBP-type peptidyl-prolyl cis-trans isomerase FklB